MAAAGLGKVLRHGGHPCGRECRVDRADAVKPQEHAFQEREGRNPSRLAAGVVVGVGKAVRRKCIRRPCPSGARRTEMME